MLLDHDSKMMNIIAAQITKVFYPFVLAKTETGEYLHINLSDTERDDPLFWDELRSILQAKLWVPVGRKYHQLLDDGWLVADPQPELAFEM
ncbi:hypothetical protein FD04_GL001641 [Secundilactobacillus odoratitofui DSM 19909 = JCM 15043]|uniref:Uncharacterized protein n=1 Tax=Secundilactobacillus odoratitofui DSM 19909 = JCM 15043 TaxID=1423776 RepID=A0A0R1LP16_9LACO|nr:hypothetical protein [Secundilactobacillus odoratitofui]KRK97606.1 hypothetical protein FD04_GL001641 [Secundilactobacillus odoratitofui DSM 19909 = JCM 15043]